MNMLKGMRVMARLMSTATVTKKVNTKDLQPMIYPYTHTAKIIQFPWKYHFKNSWLHRYILYSMVVCYPLFVWIHFKVNSPEAKIAWETKNRLDFEKEHKHEWDI